MSTKEIEDDPSIPNDETLYRQVPPIHRGADGKPTSAAFQNHPDYEAFSVILDSILRESGRTPEDLLFPGYEIWSFTAGQARDLGQKIVRRPEETERAHGHVVGPKKKKVKRGFKACSVRAAVAPPISS